MTTFEITVSEPGAGCERAGGEGLDCEVEVDVARVGAGGDSAVGRHYIHTVIFKIFLAGCEHREIYQLCRRGIAVRDIYAHMQVVAVAHNHHSAVEGGRHGDDGSGRGGKGGAECA